MCGCDKTVTITHLGYDGESDTDTEQTRTLKGCSWHGKNKTSVDSTGLHAARVFQCRIPVSAVGKTPLEIAVGDRITCDGVTATVLDWHDNRGRPAGHWYVEAS